jgi:hypothetical protein
LAGTSLTLEIGGADPSLYDQIVVNGTLTLGGELVIRFLNNYVPASNAEFPLITTPTVAGGSFSQVRFENIEPSAIPESWQDGSFAITLVPEPSAICLAGVFIVTACLRSRRSISRI